MGQWPVSQHSHFRMLFACAWSGWVCLQSFKRVGRQQHVHVFSVCHRLTACPAHHICMHLRCSRLFTQVRKIIQSFRGPEHVHMRWTITACKKVGRFFVSRKRPMVIWSGPTQRVPTPEHQRLARCLHCLHLQTGLWCCRYLTTNATGMSG